MNKSIHFIGIGGIGMSGIAQIMIRQGYRVSGSDVKDGPNCERLKALGVEVSIGHSQDNIKDDVDLVVYSSAIKQDNSELFAAAEKHIPILKRAQVLADLMKDKIGISVAGAHGKTTTTSLASFVLNHAGLLPTVVAGGIVINFNDNAMLGDSNYFVAEMDESDGSFLYFKPTYATVTNIDYEHVDYYHSWENIVDAYRRFINLVKPDGCLFACLDNEHVESLIKSYSGKCITFGLSDRCDIYAEKIESKNFVSTFYCIYKGKTLGKIELKVPGKHNISNALSVIALALELKIDFKVIQKALALYKGVQRRFQIKPCENNITIVDDYGHHPTEIEATLEALNSNNTKNSIVIFQPHRYTRTKFLMDEFVRSLSKAENLIITDIYPASEKPIEGVSAMNMCERLKNLNCNNVQFIPKERIVEHVTKIAKQGDFILTLGAGDIGRISDELLSSIKENNKGKN